MNILLVIASIGFSLWIVKNTFFWVSLWQLKEYRFDRFFIHLRDTMQGRDILFSPLLFLKIAAILAYTYALSAHENLLPYDFFVFLTFTLQGIFVLGEMSSGNIKRPVLTYKAFAITFLTFICIFTLFFFPFIFEGFFWLLIIERLIPFIVAILIFFFSFPTEFYQDLQIKRAAEKIRAAKKLLVIGVTGSYGKSSTKDYIAQILGKEFRVVKTKGTNNTPIGVANTILSGLQKNTEIFIVEMGAYKIGEMDQICQIVHPKIGVLTAVNQQHLSLFGSVENTMRAKYELVERLPKNGIAIFNGNNANSYNLYKKTKKKKILYVCDMSIKSDIKARSVVVEETRISFDVYLKRRKLHMEAPLLGGHNIENILPGIYIADFLGVSAERIKKAVGRLTPLPKTMVKHEVGGISVIDDTFNANPKSVLSALDYIKIYKGKKTLVLQPMIELGKEAESEHYRIGLAISSICDFLFLTSKNFFSSVNKGIKDGNGKCVVKSGSVAELLSFINKLSKKGDIVFFEGKEAGLVLNKML